MEAKKLLKVTGRSIDPDGKVCEACAVVPYFRGGAAKLPDVPPFNTNVWLSGDDGYNMMYIEFTDNGKISYFYNSYYDFVDGKCHAEKMIGGKMMIFDFELIDEE